MSRVYKLIPIEQLVENDYNPRKFFEEGSISRLCNSIDKIGLRNPLDVRPIDDDKYEVVSGTRRFRCVKRLKWDLVPCMVEELTRQEAVRIAIHENLQRADLSPIEEAELYYQIIAANIEMGFMKNVKKHPHRYTDEELKSKLEKEYGAIATFSHNKSEVKEAAEQADVSADTISRLLRLLNLPDIIQEEVHLGKLDVTQAYELARLSRIVDKKVMFKEMMELYKQIKKGRFTSMSLLKRKISDILYENLDKVAQEKEQLQKNLERLEQRIKDTNDDIERLENALKNDFEEDNKKLEAINMIEDELDEDNLVSFRIKTLKEFQDDNFKERIREYDSKLFDLETLYERIEKDDIEQCPYCLSDINLESVTTEMGMLKGVKENLESEKEKYQEAIEILNDLSNRVEYTRKAIEQRQDEISGYYKRINGIKETLDEE